MKIGMGMLLPLTVIGGRGARLNRVAAMALSNHVRHKYSGNRRLRVLGLLVAENAVLALVRGDHQASREIHNVADDSVFLAIGRSDSAAEGFTGAIRTIII